jgi:glycosyltransferase involved in cell wall biosynthesis
MTARGRHVLIFSVVFPPDNVSTAHLVGFLADDLTAAGHRVTVVTTRPHSRPEPGAPVPQGRIIRIPVPRKGTSSLRNALIWLIYLIGALVAGSLRGARPDVVLAVTPPPGIGLVGSWVARRWRAPLIYNVKELYPDVAIALGVFANRPLVAAMRRVEDRAFRRAAVVTAITRDVAERITARGGRRVEVIPDCVDLDAIAPGADPGAFRREFGIHAPLVIGYAGNLGVPQDLDLLLDAAARLTDLPLQVVIVGDGTERERLAARVVTEGIGNVVMVPHQPAMRMPEIYAACDLMYVPLAPGVGHDVMPSKAYQALAAERPMLVAAPADSSLADLARDSGAGIVVAPLTAVGVAAATRSIDRSALAAMGRKGRDHVRSRYSRLAVSAAYARLVDSAPGE